MISDNLRSLDGQLVTVVRPFFGTQSDSFMGELEWVKLMGLYQLVLNDHSMIFKLEDVVSVEMTHHKENGHEGFSQAVIRLKGPKDYIPRRLT